MNAHFLRGFFCVLSSVLVPVAVHPATEPLSSLEKVSSDWVKTRVETVRAETEWASQRDLLDSLVKAHEERAGALEVKRDFLKAKTAKDRSELDGIRTTNQASVEQLQAVESSLKALDEKLLRLKDRLPPRLSSALELPYRSLADPGLAPGERMQHTMTVLNRCAQFNRTISCSEEIVAIAGEEKPKLLQTIYWGLSHGYAWDRATGKTWLGSPTPAGWRWEPCPEATKSVSALIAAYNDKAEPEFVAVPARAGHTLSSTSSK